MQIPVKEAERGMVIDDGKDEVLINEVWDQGKGLGVVIKGIVMTNDSFYHRRFLNPDLMVDVKARNML